jgi:hypothetical protein
LAREKETFHEWYWGVGGVGGGKSEIMKEHQGVPRQKADFQKVLGTYQYVGMFYEIPVLPTQSIFFM